MPVLLDTGVLVAAINRRDVRHEEGQRVLRQALSGKHGTPLSIDHVLDEGLTFLRARRTPPETAEAFAALFWDPDGHMFDWRTTDMGTLQEATSLYMRHAPKGLSMTDCILLAHANQLGACIATFDAGFKGLVAVVE